VTDVLKHYFAPNGVPDTMTAARYKSEKLAMMQLILDSLRPDYLTMEMEPGTQYIHNFKLLSFSPDSTASYVQYFISHLNKHNTLIGAGAGNWDSLPYFYKYAPLALDYIDYHVYPTNGTLYNDKVFIIDSLAKAHGKKIIIGEAWAYKESDAEYFGGGNFLNTVTINQARNCFDYWQGVDTLFIKSLFHLARQAKIQMVNLFWSQYMFGQVPYSAATYGSLSYAQQTSLANTTIEQNLRNGLVGSIGIYTRSAISDYCSHQQTGLPESKLSGLHIYPNPSAGSFYISVPDVRGAAQISLSDMAGRVVYTQNTVTTDAMIEVKTALDKGMYLVRLLSSDTEKFAPIVIE
jgi:Secretion system C-terminal sorting domain